MENTPLTTEKFADEFVRFQVNLVKVIDEKFKKVDARFDSMEKKFDEKFKKVDDRFDLCATKEQFTLLEKGIAQVAGSLLQMESNMKAFVVRDELPQDILSRLRLKNPGVLAVRDADKKVDSN